MTGRGKYRYHRPSSNPDVSIAISLSVTPTHFDPTSSTPLYLVVSARILTSSQPDKPITLATFLNPFDHISSRSFSNITCTFPESSTKFISIWPKYHVKRLAIENVREVSNFVTVKPGETIEVRHEVPRDAIRAAGLVRGERYEAKLTEVGLGTDWWSFKSLEEIEGLKFKRWSDEEEEEADDGDECKKEEYGGERDGRDDGALWVESEDPRKLALVLEKGEAEFEII